MLKITETVNISGGLHARPANLLIKTAEKFTSSILISKDSKEVDGKRLLGVLTLGARQGDQITIIADGPDEKEAIQALKKLFDNNFEV
ncbi:MAG: HPr family phosphocarrier protein [Epulopiscium sp.]|nr:HPr family phosphocarrier protein [Candidatus Epulonipiscium sp.]